MLLENSIGSKIKIIREKQGLSQSEVVTKLKEKNIISVEKHLVK